MKIITLMLLALFAGSASGLQTDVATGNTSTLFINNGSLYCAGSVASGACGDGEYATPDQQTALATAAVWDTGPLYSFFEPTYVGFDNVKTVDAVRWKSAFLTDDGRVYWMGFHGGKVPPTEIVDLYGATDITLMGGFANEVDHLFALIDGQVYAYSFQYQTVTLVSGLPFNVTAIDGDSSHVMFLTGDGALFASGDNTYGQLGFGHFNSTSVYNASPVVDVSGSPLIGVQRFSAGHELSMAVVNGVPYAWGRNRNGALGVGVLDETITRNYAAVIENFTGGIASNVSTNGSTLIHTESGDIWAMGWHNAIMEGAFNRDTAPTKIITGGVTDLFVNNGDVWFVRHNGQIKGWGGGLYGQSAYGSSIETHTITLILEFVGGPPAVCSPIEVEVPGPTEYVEVEVEVEVPGPTVYVDVPGPTEYIEVEVPGPTEYVEVEVPGPTEYIEVEVPGPTEYIEVEVPGPTEYIEVEVPGPTEYVEVEVPGPTVYVDVPGPTEYIEVEVPGPTEYVEVEGPTVYVDVPGPTVYVDVPGPTEYIEVEVPGPTEYVEVIKYVEVKVPGPTVYVDVPGPTVYVDVPGPTVYVDVPGPTEYIEVPIPGPVLYVDRDRKDHDHEHKGKDRKDSKKQHKGKDRKQHKGKDRKNSHKDKHKHQK